MDRIVIKLNETGTGVDRIFIQQDQGSGAKKSVMESVAFDSASVELQGAITSLTNLIEQTYGHVFNSEKVYRVSVDISPDPQDNTISRKAFADLPIELGDDHVVQYAVVKHYRNGVYIPQERTDYVRDFHIRKGRTIIVDGQEVDEYGHFLQLASMYPMLALIQMGLLQEDAIGKMNRDGIQPTPPLAE